MTAPEVKFQNVPPAVEPRNAIQQGFSHLPPKKDDGTDKRLFEHERTTTLDRDKIGLELVSINIETKHHESRIAREILDAIDADTLRAAQLSGGTKPQIMINRDRIATFLGMHDNLKRPDEVYADEAWEICIIWRSEFGRVEIGTEEDGSIGYYVSRTLSDKMEEERVRNGDRDEIRQIFSWLEADSLEFED